MNLEYLMIFQQSGLPVYSKCYGGFCATLTRDETLLSGFLAALSDLPKMFGQETGIQGIEMGSSKLVFSKTTSSNFIICVGYPQTEVSSENTHLIQKLFLDIKQLLEGDFKNVNWNNLSDLDVNRFETSLVDNILNPWFNLAHTSDSCPLGNNCPLIVTKKAEGRREKIWNKLRDVYGNIKTQLLIQQKTH